MPFGCNVDRWAVIPYTLNKNPYHQFWLVPKRKNSKVMADRLGISQGDHVLGVKNSVNALLLPIGNGNDSIPLAPFMKTPL